MTNTREENAADLAHEEAEAKSSRRAWWITATITLGYHGTREGVEEWANNHTVFDMLNDGALVDGPNFEEITDV